MSQGLYTIVRVVFSPIDSTSRLQEQ
jgi:hypothetical protein